MFEDALHKCNTPRPGDSIGTYAEKTLHAVLKHAYEPDEANHEIPCRGFIADIKNGGGIIEIQTNALYRLKGKLGAFLETERVAVVFPLAACKWLVWLDTQSGELTKKRKSPKTGTVFDAVREIYGIRDYLAHPNFELRLVFLDIEERRNLDGWSKNKKRGSSRAERYPKSLCAEYRLNRADDYLLFLPPNLPNEFTSADFVKSCKRNASTARIAINLLLLFGHIEQIGKKGNARIYKLCK